MKFGASAVLGSLFVFTVLGSAQMSIGAGESGPAGLPKNEVRRGLAISPVRLNLRGKNRQLVGLGSYIVNAQGACMDCHSNPAYVEGGNPFQGQQEQINTDHFLAGGRAFGPFVSANLTPDAEGLPAGLTWQEFRETIRTGHDPDEDDLLQVMPWPVFAKMTDRDLRAIYEYLRAIPHAEPGGGNAG